jgi:hypothetical protein
MKRPLILGLSVLLLSAVTATAAHAGTRIEYEIGLTQPRSSQVLNTALTPNDLANLSYQGYFRDQGIPSYGRLIADYEAGRIQAKDIVQAAITANRLSANTLNDQGYINAVMQQLAGLDIH